MLLSNNVVISSNITDVMVICSHIATTIFVVLFYFSVFCTKCDKKRYSNVAVCYLDYRGVGRFRILGGGGGQGLKYVHVRQTFIQNTCFKRLHSNTVSV